VTGNYTFLIAGDDQAELWISTDEDMANEVRVANVPSWTNPQEFTKFLSQRSVGIPLEFGRKYYIEAVHKQHVGGANLAVAWIPPGATQQIIPGARLSPWTGTGARRGLEEANASAGGVARALRLYPNPATSHVVIQGAAGTDSEATTWQIAMTDAAGRTFYESTVAPMDGQVSIDLAGAGLPTGIYTVLVTEGSGARHALRLVRQ